MNITKYTLLLMGCTLVGATAMAQEEHKLTVTGSVQSDVLVPQNDDKIGTDKVTDKVLTNTYAEVHAMSQYVDAGMRFEFNKYPLPGFTNGLEKDFAGYGIPFLYVKGKYKNAELTLGNFYEQFGSGFILRTYEERTLGIDNSLFGARIAYRPVAGVSIKALTGKQRRYWEKDWKPGYNKSLITGGDVELSLDQWIKPMDENNVYLTLGGSFINKHEKTEDIMADPTHKLNLPQNVNAFDVRANLLAGGFNVLAEYAQKTEDPSLDNGYIYRNGNVAMLSASYSQSGMSFLVQAKRSDNMSFRSRRSMGGTSSFINHLPAFTMDQTYSLAALYPYATHPDGEWAYQAQVGYKFKRRTALGGKYGMNVKLNYSYVHAIDRNNHYNGTASAGTDGYGSAFWKWGDQMYYQDLNVQVEKPLSRAFKLSLMYMNQFYNKTIVEGKGGMIHSNIFIAEGKYRINSKFTLRGEAQYLTTGEDEGDWAFGLLELSMLPNWMFTVSDMYNCGATNLHYYQALVTYNIGSHRIQAGYGRTRAGYNCSGGVCRWVPASKGFTLSYNYNF